MTNPLRAPERLIDIGTIVDIGAAGLDLALTCGIFPQVKAGQTCQGISFGNNCCAGFVTGPGDIGGGDAACPPGTRRAQIPEIGAGSGLCVSIQDPAGPARPRENGQAQVNGKVCCAPGFRQAADGSARCVKTRKTNFGNISAAKRAVRRLSGAQRALRSIESLVEKTVKPAKRPRAPRAPRAKACGC